MFDPLNGTLINLLADPPNGRIADPLNDRLYDLHNSRIDNPPNG